MYCMINNESTGPAQNWLREQSSMPGTSHDNSNTIYGHLPPEDLLTEVFYLPADIELPELIMIAGKFLATASNAVLIGTPVQFKALFATPHHKLWCGRYETWQALEVDHKAVFGVGIDGRKDLAVLIAEARQAIYQVVTA